LGGWQPLFSPEDALRSRESARPGDKRLGATGGFCHEGWVKIYTKTGDAGETGLFSGERVAKCHPRVSAYGALDEMNSVIGIAVAACPAPEVRESLESVQRMAFELGSDLATVAKDGKRPRIGADQIRSLEAGIDQMAGKLPALRVFILPGGTPAAAQIQLARAVCRRVEREVIAAMASEVIPRESVVFLNRLSDYLFTLARYENFLSGVKEPEWKPAG